MLKRPEQMVRETKEQLRGGNGTVELMHLFKPDEMHNKNAKLMARFTLNPGCSVGLHSHDADEEIYYILKGNATVNDNGVKKEVFPGVAVITGGGATHALENTGDEPLEFIALILNC